MRQYAWYSPNLNVIILQTIMKDCRIAFEWDHWDMAYVHLEHPHLVDPTELGFWIPLGEL